MKLVIAFITCDRVAYSQRTLETLKSTLTVPHHIIAVDNASSDGTQEWLRDALAQGLLDSALTLADNRYPGYSANAAWSTGLVAVPDTDFLMRCDNDMEFRQGWVEEAEAAFDAMPLLGQLGLMNQQQVFEPEPNRIVPYCQNGYTLNRYWTNIGGTHIMRRELWERGIRYDEARWRHVVDASGAPVPTPQEDVRLSLDIQSAGMYFGNLIPNLVTEMSYGHHDEYPDYYARTFTERGQRVGARDAGAIPPPLN